MSVLEDLKERGINTPQNQRRLRQLVEEKLALDLIPIEQLQNLIEYAKFTIGEGKFYLEHLEFEEKKFFEKLAKIRESYPDTTAQFSPGRKAIHGGDQMRDKIRNIIKYIETFIDKNSKKESEANIETNIKTQSQIKICLLDHLGIIDYLQTNGLSNNQIAKLFEHLTKEPITKSSVNKTLSERITKDDKIQQKIASVLGTLGIPYKEVK